MRRYFAIGCVLALALPAAAEDRLVVHILCTGAQTSQGSGVIVSSDGHVLTAAHVMPDGSTCTASLGSTESDRVTLIRERVVEGFDAALARLDTDRSFPLYATICPLEKERDIVTAAFHSRMTGPPARKQGIISTVTVENGSVQITSPVNPAESGGPVFLRGTTALVGIVKGADFDALGLPIRRMVPAVALTDIALTPAVDCTPREEAVSAEIIGLIESLRDDLARAAGEAGVTEKAIIYLAQRIAGETETLDQALTELENAVDIAIDVQRRGTAPSEAGPFVEAVFRDVAALSKEGQHDAASLAVDSALAQLDVAEESIRTARLDLLESGIDTDLLRRDVPSAVARIVQKVTLEIRDPSQIFEALRAEQDIWFRRGRDQGVNLDLEVAIALAEDTVGRAATRDERGAALNDLGVALWRLGERESGTGRLEEAVTIHKAALKERPRNRVPLDWAATQGNLGLVLWSLGIREGGTGRLEAAVAAYEAALEEFTRDRTPVRWARTQNNLGSALQSLGEREAGTGRLEEAVMAYQAALEERIRDFDALEWAQTQNNLGNALSILGIRENGTERLKGAVIAYRAALEEGTRDRVPLRWAMTQNNLGNALQILGTREIGTKRLEDAVAAHRAALEERTRDRVPLEWAQSQNNLGAALQTLGARESGTARLEEAVDAFQAALEVRTRDHGPFAWAGTIENMALVEGELFRKTGDVNYLASASARLESAREVYLEAGSTYFIEKNSEYSAWIDGLESE